MSSSAVIVVLGCRSIRTHSADRPVAAKVGGPFRFVPRIRKKRFRMPPRRTTVTEDRPLRADAQRNRRRVLDAAEAVFAEAGNGATIEDVAKRAGVGVGTVCRHFPTKQALLDEVLTESFRELLVDARRCARRRTSRPPPSSGSSTNWPAHQAKRRALAEQMASELAAAHRRRTSSGRSAPRPPSCSSGPRPPAPIRADISPADTSMLFAGIAQITAIVGGDADRPRPLRRRHARRTAARGGHAAARPAAALRRSRLVLKARQARGR